MSAQQNTAVVTEFRKQFSAADYAGATVLLTEDATWWVAGSTALSGTCSKPEFVALLGQVGPQARNGITVTPGVLTTQDDRVSMAGTSYGEITNGRTDQNSYHFMMVLPDGKICAVREYLDSGRATAVFGN